jgi:hypothetical protein
MKRWIPILLIAVTSICYCRLFQADFTLFDDIFTVEYNPLLNPPSVKNVLGYWKPFQPNGKVNGQYGLYIPLTYTYWSAIATVARTPDANSPGAFELNPYLFHIGNALLHALSGVLVFKILKRLLQTDWPACAGALVFLLHPVQVEAVGWISGAKDLLAGLLALTAVWEYLQFRSSPDPKWHRLHYALMLLASLCAMLAKPSAITVPAILLIIDATLLGQTIRKSALTLSPIVLLAAIFAVVGALAQDTGNVSAAPLWTRPLIAGDALAFYVYKLLVPVRLCVDYGRSPADVISHGWFYFAWMIPTLAGFLLWRVRRSKPMLLTGALIFFIAAAPTLGFTTFLFQRYSTTADHYLYLPMFGIACIVGELLRRQKSVAVWVGSATIALLLTCLTIVQAGVWHNSRALFTHTAHVNPRSFMAQLDLASIAMEEGNLAEAEYRLQLCRDCQPYMDANVKALESQLERMKAITYPAK